MFGMMTIKSLGFIELGLAGFLNGRLQAFFGRTVIYWLFIILMMIIVTIFIGVFLFLLPLFGVPLAIGVISQYRWKRNFGFYV